jgi:hypothetical protein
MKSQLRLPKINRVTPQRQRPPAERLGVDVAGRIEANDELVSVQGRAQIALHESNVSTIYCTIRVDIFPEV